MEMSLGRVVATARALVAALVVSGVAEAAATGGQMAVINITRFASGDYFTIASSGSCGPARCAEVSRGSALPAGPPCSCQCPGEAPAFREDHNLCVAGIDECEMALFGRETWPHIPSVFLPLEGQIIHPAQEIIFTDEENSGCDVSSAQYLSASGWVTIGRRKFDKDDVPFAVYRDQGKTFLRWRGSSLTRARLEGRLVLAHVFCKVPPAVVPTTAVCAAFRVDGVAQTSNLDVPSIVFNAGETSDPTSSGLSVLESLAIGVCVLLLIFIYAAGIVFYVHYKKRNRRKEKDAENSNTVSTNDSDLETRINMENVTLKTNPLLKMNNYAPEFLQDTLSDVSEMTEENLDLPEKCLKKPHLISAMVHATRKKSIKRIREHMTSPKQKRSVSPNRGIKLKRSMSPDMERAPQSHLSIVDCRDLEPMACLEQPNTSLRRKLYFNPVFFEPEHLKNPPPAAVEFLEKIREVMSVAKDKMTTKKFFPILTDIPEEELYHAIDLGWDIPCGRRGRRFSAISLKRENSRRSHRCTGCPGCDTSSLRDIKQLTRSNSCKSCVSEEFKQKIVRKWLDDVPPPLQPARPIKSVAMVSGTPRVTEPKKIEKGIVNSASIDKTDIVVISSESPSRMTRKVRKRLPPPPPPPVPPPPPPDDAEMPKEIKEKMEAVIQELSEFKRVEPIAIEDVRTEFTKPIQPRIVIPVLSADMYDEDMSSKRRSEIRCEYEIDSLERGAGRKRRFSLAEGSDKKNLHRDGTASMDELENSRQDIRLRLSKSFKDVRKIDDNARNVKNCGRKNETTNLSISEVFISPERTYDNLPRPGALTIQVRGSPINERKTVKDDFDPDTLDRKPRIRAIENHLTTPKKVDKIQLKSAGSFKYKSTALSDDTVILPDFNQTKKIGSLRQIYEAKTKAKSIEDESYYLDRKSSSFKLDFDQKPFPPFGWSTKTPDLIRQTEPREKPPVPPKQTSRYSNVARGSPPSDTRRRGSPDESRSQYSRAEILHARRSGRKSARFRNRRADIKKLYKTEDSGYLSTDSNESKRRARFMMHIRARAAAAEAQQTHEETIASDTDEFESLCDGQSESGAESVETDSVFFGNVDSEPERLYTEFGINAFMSKAMDREGGDQMDSGFVGETSIIVSGDSDSEHRSVISIVTGRDGRASAASVRSVALHEDPYAQSVEC